MSYRLVLVLALVLGLSTGPGWAETKQKEAASASAAQPDLGGHPKINAGANAPQNKHHKPKAKKKPAFKGKPVGINTASKEELMKLPGVTAEIADKIIANRPFLTKGHLLSKDLIPYDTYQKIKDRIAADGKAPF